MPFRLPVGRLFENLINWLTTALAPFFDAIQFVLNRFVDGLEFALLWPPSLALIVIFALIAVRVAGWRVMLFTLLGMALIDAMGLWDQAMNTLALVGTSTVVALLLGIPLGVWASRRDLVESIIRPILDFMQTMPAFVYLIPAVLFFGLGTVPGVVATVIFAMPPAVRLTNLGIRQVPREVVQAAISFGATPRQLLMKVQLPIAVPTIMAGINQTIMLALSMVVIAALIGASGLGSIVLQGITQLEIGKGFEGGIAVVILAIFLDRLTGALGKTPGGGRES